MIVRVRKLDVAMKKAFGIAGGAQEHARNVLVEVVLGDGTRGWGEGAPFPAFNGETQEQALAAAARAELADDASLEARILEACADSPSARCAIETAVVDARARRAGVPLHVFFGGAGTRLVTDVTITTGTVEEARSEARAFAAFSTLKIKVGRDVEDDIARVRAVREARPDATLLVDANGGFTLDEALHFARACPGIALFEQPIAPGAPWDAFARVRAEGVRVAIDESVTSAADVDAAAPFVDAVNLKIMKSGIFEGVRIAERAKARGLLPMIGGMVETRLAMGTSAAIAAGMGGFAFIDLDTPLFLAEDPFGGGYAQDGEELDLGPVLRGHGLEPRHLSRLSVFSGP